MVVRSTERSKPLVNIEAIGHVGHGKATLTAAISKVLRDKYPDLNPFTPSGEIDAAELEEPHRIAAGVAHVGYETERRRYQHIYARGPASNTRHMIMGATQVDGAILVVAATDGPTAQTREHVLLARQAGVPHLLVALNKSDMVEDEEILELVEMEVRELLSSQGFDGDNAPVLRVSGLKALDGDLEWIGAIERLLTALDTYLPDPIRNLDEPFLMAVDGAFVITGRGTVVTGEVARGKLPIDSEVEILGIRALQRATVVGIQVFHEQVGEVRAGERCRLLLRGIAGEEVERGQVVARPGTIAAHTEFKAQFYLLGKDEGGRDTALHSGDRPQFYFRTTDVTGVITLPEGAEMVMPGENTEMTVALIQPIALEEGLGFAVRVGGRTVGSGVVTRVGDPSGLAVSLLNRVDGALSELRWLERDLDASRIAAELDDSAPDKPATVTALLNLVLGGLVFARYGLESALRPTASVERRRSALAILDLWDGARSAVGRGYLSLLPQSYAMVGLFAGDPSGRIDETDGGALGDRDPYWMGVGWQLRAMSEVDPEWGRLWRRTLEMRAALGIDLAVESRRSPRVQAMAASIASSAAPLLRPIQVRISPESAVGQLAGVKEDSLRAWPSGRGSANSGLARAGLGGRERQPLVDHGMSGAAASSDADRRALASLERDGEGGARVRVWFGTNRRPALTRGVRTPAIFGNRRGSDLHLGACDVSVPIGHRFGSTGSPVWRTWLLGAPRDEMLSIDEVHLFDTTAEFASALVTDFAGAAPVDRRALVYLHGYSTSFRQAALRAAQIGFDLRVEGAVAFYSWPSQGHPLAYPADTQAAQASEDQFIEFLEVLGSRAGVARIDFLVHSLGNQLFARAAARMVAAAGRAGIPSGSLIMAAPDIDCDVFTSLARVYPQLASSRTMYVSNRDRALWLSKWMQHYARAGYAPPVTIVDGVDTVHVGDVDVSTLGHGYFAEAEPVLYDMRAVLDGLAPDRRMRLVPREYSGKGYWSLRA